MLEAEAPREPPRGRDEHCVDPDLPDRVAAHRAAHAEPPLDGHADCGLHRRDDAFLLLGGDPAPHRQREVLGCCPLGLRQRSGLVARGTPSPAGDAAASRSTRRDAIPASSSAAAIRSRSVVRTTYMWYTWPGVVGRQLDDVAEPELGVPRGGLAPCPVPAGEVRQEARGAPPPGSRRAGSSFRRARRCACRASRGSGASAPCPPRTSSVQATSPPSPSAKRFFVGKKLNVEQTPVVATPGAPNACAASSSSGRPERRELLELRRPAEEVDGDDRLRPLRDERGDGLGIEVERDRVDVREDGCRARRARSPRPWRRT